MVSEFPSAFAELRTQITGYVHCARSLFAISSKEVHPHDLSTILDKAVVAIRPEYHCTQPLHQILNILSTARASLYFHNTREEIDAFVAALKAAIAFFGGLG